jgi:hypothetical protein
MHYIQDGIRSLRFLVLLNLDRLIWPLAIVAGLSVGNYFGGF